jgi:hypothetical protein
MLYSPPKKASPKPSPMTTRKYMGLNLMQTSSHNSPPSLPADFSDLASVMSNDVDLTSSPGSPRRKVFKPFCFYSLKISRLIFFVNVDLCILHFI